MKDAVSCSLLCVGKAWVRIPLAPWTGSQPCFALWRWQAKLQAAPGSFQGYFQVHSCKLPWASAQENVCCGISPYTGHCQDTENSGVLLSVQ